MPFANFLQDDGFTNISEITEGASGYSFKAFDPSLHREVFIKFYETVDGTDERILSEPRKIAALFADNTKASEHIASVYSASIKELESDRYIQIVTEYCPGESLYKKIKSQRLYISEALEYAKDIIDALHVLHQQNIVHRDIKPSNLVISGNQIKIIDLGSATEIEPGLTYIETTSKHSPFYRPPEAFPPENKFGKYSDIYQAGLVLYEMINGPIEEKPDHYIVPKIRDEYEKLKRLAYSEMEDYDKCVVQDQSLLHLSKSKQLLPTGSEPKKWYTKSIQTIVNSFIEPDLTKRINSCYLARIQLSSYDGPNWKEETDGSLLIKNYSGYDYIFREEMSSKGSKFISQRCKSGSKKFKNHNVYRSFEDVYKNLFS